MDKYDSAAAAAVWQRVNPQEEPYPDAPRGGGAGMMLPQPMPPVPSGSGGRELYRGLLREEVRHIQQVLSMLENALA